MTSKLPEKVRPEHIIIINRRGEKENLKIDRITSRINDIISKNPHFQEYPALSGEDLIISIVAIINTLVKSVDDKAKIFTTTEIDNIVAEKINLMSESDYRYSSLAGALAATNISKNIIRSFTDQMKYIEEKNKYTTIESDKTEKIHNYIHPVFIKMITDKESFGNNDFNSIITGLEDYYYNYEAVSVCDKQRYLIRVNNGKELAENLPMMYLRIACGLYINEYELTLSIDLDTRKEKCNTIFNKITKLYKILSSNKALFGSPIIFHAGTSKSTLISCLFGEIDEDSVNGIYDSLKKYAIMASGAAGVAMECSSIRPIDDPIRSVGGKAKGVNIALRSFNQTSKHIEQKEKRSSSLAPYLSIFHPEVHTFINQHTEHGVISEKSKELFHAITINQVFVEKVMKNEMWYFFSPMICPEIFNTFGTDLKILYEKLVAENKYHSSIKAVDIFNHLNKCTIEGGLPYIINLDGANSHNMQDNIGNILMSNLCTEIMQVTTSPKYIRSIDTDKVGGCDSQVEQDCGRIAACNLSCIVLTKFVDPVPNEYTISVLPDKYKNTVLNRINVAGIIDTISILTEACDNVIDINRYPLKAIQRSNQEARPIGIGFMGLDNVRCRLEIELESDLYITLNRIIIETMSYAFQNASAKLGLEKGSYPAFKGSRASRGELIHTSYGVNPITNFDWSN